MFSNMAANRAAATAKAVGRNIAPSSPCKVSRGRKTRMMTRLAENRYLPTSFAASATISRSGACPARSFKSRKIFSIMMIEPLAIFPIPMARPPIDMTVSLIPNRSMITRAMRIEKGMVRDAKRALRRFHMKKIMTRMMRRTPSRMVISTCWMDLRMRTDWS